MVSQLVEKVVGHTDWTRDALLGDRHVAEYPHIDPADYLAEYDRAAEDTPRCTW
jgi:hypothetical protein